MITERNVHAYDLDLETLYQLSKRARQRPRACDLKKNKQNKKQSKKQILFDKSRNEIRTQKQNRMKSDL